MIIDFPKSASPEKSTDQNHFEDRLDVLVEELASRLEQRGLINDESQLSPVDLKSAEDEEAFFQRFHARFGRRHRYAIIRFKAEKDLTDSEIEVLIHSGSFVKMQNGIKVVSNKFFATAGWGQIFLLVTLTGFPVLMAFPGFGDWLSLVVWGIVIAVLIILSFALYYYYVLPHRILAKTPAVGLLPIQKK